MMYFGYHTKANHLVVLRAEERANDGGEVKAFAATSCHMAHGAANRMFWPASSSETFWRGCFASQCWFDQRLRVESSDEHPSTCAHI